MFIGLLYDAFHIQKFAFSSVKNLTRSQCLYSYYNPVVIYRIDELFQETIFFHRDLNNIYG